jgi:hypothetical protein
MPWTIAISDRLNENIWYCSPISIADGTRATKDVDAVVEAATLSQYHQMERRLSVSGCDARATERSH